jgi:alcohol dehydrogenase YqhD (iron-dependent ADH family)
MDNFEFFNPVRVIFGKGKVANTCYTDLARNQQ